MSYIQIDARGCGAGKTRNTIVPRIKNNIWTGIKTLLVVPSIKLQKEYSKYFVSEDFAVINSDGVSKEGILTQYQTVDTPVVCITHEAFQLIPTELFQKSNWDLIIDEVFMPYQTHKIRNYDSASRVWLNTSEMFEWTDTVIGNYRSLSVIGSTPPNLIDTKFWNRINNSNFQLFTTITGGENLMNNVTETTELFQVLNRAVLENWHSVWIAAAAFEHTMFGYWLKSKTRDYSIAYAFEKHTKSVLWHMPNDESADGFRWTKNQRARDCDQLRNFFAYVDLNRSGRAIYNLNNDDKTPVIWGNRITHNAHGVNEYSHYENYAYFSAVNANGNFKSFIAEHCGIPTKKQNGTMLDPFGFAFSGYNAYQLLMRTALRDPSHQGVVNAFFIDTMIALDIQELFVAKYQEVKCEIPVSKARPQTRSKGRKPAMTPAERKARWRLKQKTLKNTP